MKKCPFCKESIQDDAIKCKHCKSDLQHSISEHVHETAPKPIKKNTFGINFGWKKLVLSVFGLVILFGTTYGWVFIVPVILAIVIQKMFKWAIWKKALTVAGCFIMFFVIGAGVSVTRAAPTITITDPKTESVGLVKTTTLNGTVEPKTAEVSVNGSVVQTNKDGNFSKSIDLKDIKTVVTVLGKTKYASATKTITIKRDPDEAEQAEAKRQADEAAAAQAKAVADRAKAVADQKAKADAEQAAFDKTKAGKLCKAHTTWTKEECQRVADNKYWIGMSIEMLVAERGNPESINPSNYGSGTQYQYCWDYRYSPSCFYDHNNDHILDAFN